MSAAPADAPVSSIPDDAPRAYYGPDGEPQFFQDPAMDRFAAVLVKLAQEVWVLAERIDGIERVTAAKGLITAPELAAILKDAGAVAQREAALAEFVNRTLAPLREPHRSP